MSIKEPFWRSKPMAAMNRDEWESLCDGCGQCCLHKLQDDETDDVYFTNVACRLLDKQTARCMKYDIRWRFVPGCVVLTPQNVPKFAWLPATCAYRLVSEGKDLPSWHPLVSGDPQSVIAAGVSVAGKVVDEREAGDLEDHIVDAMLEPVE